MKEMSIIGKYHVVGYHLPISVENYEIEFREQENGSIEMISRFDVSKTNGCCIPFCCLFPKCAKRKEVIDRFHLENTDLKLQSSSAFGWLISCFEKGKIFHLIWIDSYLLLVNPKEIFVLSKELQSPTDQEKIRISSLIAEFGLSVNLKYIF